MGLFTKKPPFLLALLCLLFVAACERDTEEEPGEFAEEDPTRGVTFHVDESLSPGLADLDGKPLTGLLDETGRQIDFIANELIVVGDDDLDAILDRWNAEVIHTADFSSLSGDIDPFHRLLVDPSQGDIDALSELFAQHEDLLFGHFEATDEAALGLLAIAMEEQVLHGNAVAINPYFPLGDGTEPGDPLAYVDDLLTTAPEGDNRLVDGAYNAEAGTNNPALWTHFTTQGIDVPGAWRALAMAGLTDPEDPLDRIRILILDGGFLDLDLTEGSFNPLAGTSNFGD